MKTKEILKLIFVNPFEKIAGFAEILSKVLIYYIF